MSSSSFVLTILDSRAEETLGSIALPILPSALEGGSMSSGAVIAVIVGAFLVVAGIVFIFLAAANLIKEAEKGLSNKTAEEVGAGWPDVVRDFIAWLKSALPKKLVP